MTTRPTCRACGDTDLRPVLDVHAVPVFCNVLWPTRAAAAEAATGDISLALCGRCGLLQNTAFDAALVEYAPEYQNSLHHSPTFLRFAEGLVDSLDARYRLGGRTVVDVGCGDGEFLTLLAERTGARGVGFDPSFDAARAPATKADVTVRRELFTSGSGVEADLVVCRHVIEHVPDARLLVRGVREALSTSPGAAVYFEMPDATYMLETQAMWDVIYEHPSYFAAATLRAIFEREGFEVDVVGRSFADQYLYLEGRPREGDAPECDLRASVATLEGLAATFAERFTGVLERWTRELPALAADGPVAIWGAGSKGVMFATLLDPEARLLRYVVDVNPDKHGLFVPRSTHEVVPPSALLADPPAHVLVMNPIYRDEIESMLRSMGLAATVSSV